MYENKRSVGRINSGRLSSQSSIGKLSIIQLEMAEINEEEMSDVTEEEICCVCLGTINEKALLDMCLHVFCFECIKMWSRKKAVCPLCTVPFKTIMYNIKSDYEYLEYRIDDGSRTHASHRQNRLDIQQGNQALQRAREVMRRMEESLTASRLLTRSRWTSDTNIAGTSSRRNRSQIYKMNLWAKDLKRVDGIPIRVRDVRPSFLSLNEACCHRLYRWLNREVPAVLGSRVSASEVVSNVIKYCKKFYILGDQFHDKMSRIFGAKTKHFVHEFYHFASSPHEMEEYDKNVIYGPPDENCVDVVMVPESDCEEEVFVLPSSSQNTPIELSGDEDDDDDDCKDVTGSLVHKTPQISLISPKESRQTERESTCSYRPSTDQTNTREISQRERVVKQKRMSNDEDDDDDDYRIHSKKLRSVVGLNLLSQKFSKSQSGADEKHASFKKHHSGHKNRSRVS